MKYVKISMSDGSCYELPLQLVSEKLNETLLESDKKQEAADRSCPVIDLPEDDVAIIQEAVDVRMARMTDEELLETAAKEVAWSTLKDFAIRTVKPDKTNCADGWHNGLKEVAER